MTKTKKLIFNLIIIVITIIIVIFIINIIKSKKETQSNIKIINAAYEYLSLDVKNYNEIRKEYLDMSTNFILEEYEKEHEKYISLLTKYNNVVEQIDSHIYDINPRCNQLYYDTNTNSICSSYKVLYEKLINLYVSDLTSYNHKLEEYNQYKNNNLDYFEMIHNDYIDYNDDGIYEGSDSNEEN